MADGDASWPAMLCEMGSCGWNDPSTLVEILTGPDFLPNGGLTWADKDHALLMLGSFPSHTLAQHIPAFLADLGVHQHAFVFLNEWLEPAVLEPHAKTLVDAITTDTHTWQPNMRAGDERFFGALQLVAKSEAAMSRITPKMAVDIYRRCYHDTSGGLSARDTWDRQAAAAMFLDRCEPSIYLALLENVAAQHVHSLWLEPALRCYMLRRVCDMTPELDHRLLASRLAFRALSLLKDDRELDGYSRLLAAALCTLFPLSFRREERRCHTFATTDLPEVSSWHSASERLHAGLPPRPRARRMSSFNPLLDREVVIRP